MGAFGDDDEFAEGDFFVHFFGTKHGGEGVVFAGDDEGGDVDFGEDVFGGMCGEFAEDSEEDGEVHVGCVFEVG